MIVRPETIMAMEQAEALLNILKQDRMETLIQAEANQKPLSLQALTPEIIQVVVTNLTKIPEETQVVL